MWSNLGRYYVTEHIKMDQLGQKFINWLFGYFLNACSFSSILVQKFEIGHCNLWITLKWYTKFLKVCDLKFELYIEIYFPTISARYYIELEKSGKECIGSCPCRKLEVAGLQFYLQLHVHSFCNPVIMVILI